MMQKLMPVASKTNFERIIREKAPSSVNVNERVGVNLPNTLQEAINIAKLNFLFMAFFNPSDLSFVEISLPFFSNNLSSSS